MSEQQETLAERMNRRSAMFIARSNAFEDATARERRRRRVVNLTSFVIAFIVIVAYWHHLDARVLFCVIVGFVIIRAVGNGVVNAICDREMDVINAENPLPERDERLS